MPSPAAFYQAAALLVIAFSKTFTFEKAARLRIFLLNALTGSPSSGGAPPVELAPDFLRIEGQ